MKSVTIDGRVLQYQTLWRDSGEYGDYVTYFYEGTELYTYRKYWLFGKKITVQRPKKIFCIYEDSENMRLTKDWWRARIEKELELLKREEQLKKGELI